MREYLNLRLKIVLLALFFTLHSHAIDFPLKLGFDQKQLRAVEKIFSGKSVSIPNLFKKINALGFPLAEISSTPKGRSRFAEAGIVHPFKRLIFILACQLEIKTRNVTIFNLAPYFGEESEERKFLLGILHFNNRVQKGNPFVELFAKIRSSKGFRKDSRLNIFESLLKPEMDKVLSSFELGPAITIRLNEPDQKKIDYRLRVNQSLLQAGKQHVKKEIQEPKLPDAETPEDRGNNQPVPGTLAPGTPASIIYQQPQVMDYYAIQPQYITYPDYPVPNDPKPTNPQVQYPQQKTDESDIGRGKKRPSPPNEQTRKRRRTEVNIEIEIAAESDQTDSEESSDINDSLDSDIKFHIPAVEADFGKFADPQIVETLFKEINSLEDPLEKVLDKSVGREVHPSFGLFRTYGITNIYKRICFILAFQLDQDARSLALSKLLHKSKNDITKNILKEFQLVSDEFEDSNPFGRLFTALKTANGEYVTYDKFTKSHIMKKMKTMIKDHQSAIHLN